MKCIAGFAAGRGSSSPAAGLQELVVSRKIFPKKPKIRTNWIHLNWYTLSYQLSVHHQVNTGTSNYRVSCMIYWKIVSTFGGALYFQQISISKSTSRASFAKVAPSLLRDAVAWRLGAQLPRSPRSPISHRFLHVFSGPPLETAVPGPKTKQASKCWGLDGPGRDCLGLSRIVHQIWQGMFLCRDWSGCRTLAVLFAGLLEGHKKSQELRFMCKIEWICKFENSKCVWVAPGDRKVVLPNFAIRSLHRIHFSEQVLTLSLHTQNVLQICHPCKSVLILFLPP